MNVIGFIALILLAAWLEIRLFKKHILTHLEYTCTFSETEVFEGDEIELIETISNSKWLAVPCIKSEITLSKWFEFKDVPFIENDNLRAVPSLFTIRGFQKITRRWKVKCLKRGVFKIEGITLVCKDLLNFCTIGNTIRVNSEITVLPRPIQTASNMLVPHYLTGDLVVKRFIAEDPFYISGVREYSSRDSMNKIHWKMVAKQKKLMVYNNDCTSRQDLTVILNMQSYAHEQVTVINKEKIEKAIKICAGLFEDSLKLGIPIKFMCNTVLGTEETTVSTLSKWGKEPIHELFVLLSSLTLKSSDYFSKFLEAKSTEIHSTDIIIVTSFLDDDIIRFIHKKTAQNSLVKVILLDFDKHIPAYDSLNIWYLCENKEEEGEVSYVL